jgi:hypothetical protein
LQSEYDMRVAKRKLQDLIEQRIRVFQMASWLARLEKTTRQSNNSKPLKGWVIFLEWICLQTLISMN